MKDLTHLKSESEILINEILENSKETIKSNIKEALKRQVTDQLSWSMREHVSKVTNEFVEKELKEDIIKILTEVKPELLESLKGAFIKIGGQVSIAMYEQACKNLSAGSYNTKDILKKILD